jgi:heme-degrading monooxygenase HmoA
MEHIEIVKYKLKGGFTDAQFLEAEKELRNGSIKDAEGYIGRELYKSGENEWALILRFKTKENMDTFLLSLKKERPESFKAYASMIDWETMRTEFFTKQI